MVHNCTPKVQGFDPQPDDPTPTLGCLHDTCTTHTPDSKHRNAPVQVLNQPPMWHILGTTAQELYLSLNIAHTVPF